jgi:hypothetical protein
VQTDIWHAWARYKIAWRAVTIVQFAAHDCEGVTTSPPEFGCQIVTYASAKCCSYKLACLSGGINPVDRKFIMLATSKLRKLLKPFWTVSVVSIPKKAGADNLR